MKEEEKGSMSKPLEWKTLTEEQFKEIGLIAQVAEDDLQDAVEALEFKDQEVQELKSHIVNLSMKLWKAKEQSCSCTQMPW